MKRVFDIFIACVVLIVCTFVFLMVAIAIKVSSKGPVLYWSNRVGRNNIMFLMPKFRSMRVGTPAVATDLLEDPQRWLTPIGSFLRKTSLDELPQLLSIFKGDMSFVGPRPALFNQHDLIRRRTEYGVQVLVPGLTGWAQVNGRDEIPIPAKVALDVYYLQHCTIKFDLKNTMANFFKSHHAGWSFALIRGFRQLIGEGWCYSIYDPFAETFDAVL